MIDAASQPLSAAEPPDAGPPEVQPPSRLMQLLTSWKLWTVALVMAIAAIGISLSLRGYQRQQALKYLDANECRYFLTGDSEWITDRFGDWAKGLRSVDSIHLSVVSDESLSRISAFHELKELKTIPVAAYPVNAYSTPGVGIISDRGIDHLMQLSRLENVALYVGDFTDSQLARIFSADLPLVNVELNTGEVSHATLEALSRRSTLQTLELHAMSGLRDEDFRGLHPLLELEIFSITNAGPANAGPACIAWLSHSTHLRQLTLRSMRLDRESIGLISQFSELEALRFEHCDGIDDHTFELLAAHPHLELLKVSADAINWTSIDYMRQMPSLNRVVIGGGQFTDPALRTALQQEFLLAP
jgi:hypothetical protein